MPPDRTVEIAGALRRRHLRPIGRRNAAYLAVHTKKHLLALLAEMEVDDPRAKNPEEGRTCRLRCGSGRGNASGRRRRCRGMRQRS